MRARELVFHISCFSCILCGAQLSTGDTAAIRGGRVFCGEHYDADILRYVELRLLHKYGNFVANLKISNF